MSKNLVSGLLAVGVGFVYLITALLLPEQMMGDKMGPKVFPIIVGIASILAGFALCVSEFRKKATKKDKVDFGFKSESDVWIKIAILTAAGILYGLTIDFLGFIAATTAIMLVATLLINKGHLKQNIIVSVLFSVVSYLGFGIALQLSLPRGLIENLLPF